MSLYQKEGNTAEGDALAGKIKAAMDDKLYRSAATILYRRIREKPPSRFTRISKFSRAFRPAR